MARFYIGDLLPSEAWKLLRSEQDSFLIDVRTSAEWHYVGNPNLQPIGMTPIQIEWRLLPSMEKNLMIANELTSIIPNKEAKLFFLCRTGGRSMEAAIEITNLGYKYCYNILNGFEGDLDGNFQRGKVSGWKAEKLPWRQD